MTDKKVTSDGLMSGWRRRRSRPVAPPAEGSTGTERLFLFFFRKRRDAQRASEELIAHGYRVRCNEPDRQNPDWWLAVHGRTELDDAVIDETWRHWAREVGGEYGGSDAPDDETHGQHQRYLDELRRPSAWIYASFANGLGGGNPAGVVLSATPLALEEPASGTTSAALALYLRANGWLTADALVVEQGIEMGRPSRIDVTVATPDTVIVPGRARKLLAGTLMPWSDDEGS